ncbi:hypothetical protein KFK14_20055 [Sphingobium phenoxybenzoativorans]|uniref:Uncharacterized protein n=1 Tax=Sphingobium phenoxybenzoativorans TaxID=1592790 RepID=A0A975Q1D7_9SPHN|nr:hypothetical protein [Sphingobium phenoxybenzoativorans]QUT05263.1 hypothetical protein KFK14_20055 [Sphingobium phenoxybenzoativorans]
MIELTPENIQHIRTNELPKRQSEMFHDVGYFITWYSVAELGITALLAVASGSRDLIKFDILCGGMDCRVKIERLRKCVNATSKIGKNLDARLKYMDEKARPIRNRLAHSSLTHAESGPQRYYASSIASLPWKELGMDNPAPSNPPITIMPEQLLGWGTWFNHFYMDLSQAFNLAIATGEFEIKNPTTKVPSANRANNPARVARAKRNKPSQKYQQ